MTQSDFDLPHSCGILVICSYAQKIKAVIHVYLTPSGQHCRVDTCAQVVDGQKKVIQSN